jgi:glycosyltransferase involved in cell wall biosynthesis
MHYAIFQPMKIPRHKAHTIQVLNTWWAMAHLGHPCMLLVREIKKELSEVLRFYGLEPNCNLLIRQVPWQKADGPWWPHYVLKASRMLPEPFRQVVYTREIGIGQCLLRLRPEMGWRVFLELHNLPSALTGELEAAAEDERERQGLKRRREQESSVEQEVIPFVDGIICISAGLRDMLTEKYGKALPPSVVIPGGATIGSDPPPPLCSRKGVAYVGHLQPNRGVETLICALKYLEGQTITLAGGNDPVDVARIERMARQLGVRAQIHMPGCLEPMAARELLSRARVAVMTSRGDCLVGRVFASHTKLFEYMAAGAAIVAADVPTVHPPLEHMRNAILVPPDHPEEMARAIRLLIQDDVLAQSISRQALEDVRAYSWDRRAARIHAFVKAAVANPKG